MRIPRVFVLSTASFIVLAITLSPRAAQAQWKKQIDWLFVCSALLEAKFGADSRLCDDVHGQAGIKATLDEASFLLESLHFASPAISANLDLGLHMEDASAGWQALQLANERDPRCEVRYCAWLVFGLGKYGAHSSADSSLVLDPFRTNVDGELESGWSDGFGLTEIHELFHAVQFGYANVERAYQEANQDGWNWIIEGTAEHVMRALGRPMGLSPAGATHFRTYDQPLHSPPTDDPDDSAFTTWAYGSWEFFDFVGNYLGSDLRIQYLDHLFKALRSNQNNGLEAVEAAVRHEASKSLYEVFPEFVARRLRSPCYFSHLGTWDGGGCTNGPDNEHRFELSFPDTVRRPGHTTAPMSANGYLVRTMVPEGSAGQLIIRVPRDEDEEYLHLIVDDQRWDEVGPAGHRNEFTTIVPAGRHEFLVRLTNVPREIAGTAPAPGFDFSRDDPAPIEFLLLERFWQAEVSGGPHSGTHSGSDAEALLQGGNLVWVDLKSDSGTRPYVMIDLDGGPGFPRGSTRLTREQYASISFAPVENLYQAMSQGAVVGYGSDALGTVQPRFPPPATVEIEEIGDDFVSGSVSGEFYRSTNPETGAVGSFPELRANVRIEFLAKIRKRQPPPPPSEKPPR